MLFSSKGSWRNSQIGIMCENSASFGSAFPHCTNGWQTQLQVCQPHHSLQNNIIICLPFDMNFNFTLLSCVAKGTKWNFSIVPIIRLPEVNFSSTIDQLSQTREKFDYILPIRQFSTLEHILLSQEPGGWYWYKYKTFFAYLKEKNCKTHLKTHFWYIFYLGEKIPTMMTVMENK